MYIFPVLQKKPVNCEADSLPHLRRSRIGKGNHQKPVNVHRIFFVRNHTDDPFHQHRCLSRSCGGRNQQISVAKCNYFLLIFGKADCHSQICSFQGQSLLFLLLIFVLLIFRPVLFQFLPHFDEQIIPGAAPEQPHVIPRYPLLKIAYPLKGTVDT